MGRSYVFVRLLREADLTTSPSRVPCVFSRQEGGFCYCSRSRVSLFIINLKHPHAYGTQRSITLQAKDSDAAG